MAFGGYMIPNKKEVNFDQVASGEVLYANQGDITSNQIIEVEENPKRITSK